jgi:hypothetical protein
MKTDMTFHRNWEPSGLFRMIRAVLGLLSTLFYLAIAGVWLAHLPNSLRLIADTYIEAVASGYSSERREPEKKHKCLKRDSFITGSTVRKCEPAQ